MFYAVGIKRFSSPEYLQSTKQQKCKNYFAHVVIIYFTKMIADDGQGLSVL